MIVVHSFAVKMFDKFLFIGWSVPVFILLANIFNNTLYLFINNIVREPIIDESLFYNFYFFIKYCLEEGLVLHQIIGCYYLLFFLYRKGRALLKLRVQELLEEFL